MKKRKVERSFKELNIHLIRHILSYFQLDINISTLCFKKNYRSTIYYICSYYKGRDYSRNKYMWGNFVHNHVRHTITVKDLYGRWGKSKKYLCFLFNNIHLTFDVGRIPEGNVKKDFEKHLKIIESLKKRSQIFKVTVFYYGSKNLQDMYSKRFDIHSKIDGEFSINLTPVL